MFVPTESILEILIRGTVMYIAMFVLLRPEEILVSAW